MEQVLRELKETNDQITEKMKDILTSDGFCFGYCKKNEKEAEIQAKLQNIEDRLEENEILVKDLNDTEQKTEEDINMLKEKNKKIEADIEQLYQIFNRKKSKQNIKKVGKRVKSTNGVAHIEPKGDNIRLGEETKCSGCQNNVVEDTLELVHSEALTSHERDVNKRTSHKKGPVNNADSRTSAAEGVQNSEFTKTGGEHEREIHKQTYVVERGTELSGENNRTAATKLEENPNSEGKLVLQLNARDEKGNFEKRENGGAGSNKHEEVEDKTLWQLVPLSKEVAKPNIQAPSENRLVRRGNFDVVAHEQERWINNHKCVHQSQKKYCFQFFSWDFKANFEKQKVLAQGHFEVNAAQSLLLIDTSESMAENGGWEQTCKFVQNYLMGLEEMASEHNITQERVALVTFGRRTEVVQHLTFNMQEVKHAFDNLELGGPTPMYGGLMMIDGAIVKDTFDANGLAVHPKIILITDGNPTETDLIAGPEESNPNYEQAIKSRILGYAEILSNTEVDLFCVPVGNNDSEFLSLLVEMADGVLLNDDDGRNLARRLYLTMEASKDMGMLPGFYWDREHNMMCVRVESAFDRTEKQKIVSRIRRREDQRVDRLIKEICNESDDPKLPKIGSRVRCGPDRDPANTLDRGGPGTIVGHSPDEDCLNVTWDKSGRIEKCQYGKNGLYEVVLVEEPRILPEAVNMAIGCVVVPGKDWASDANFQGHNTKGISLAYNTEKGVVLVKWENGALHSHIFLPPIEEVMLLRDTIRSPTPRAIEPAPTAHTNKGQRNKNIK